MSTQKTVGTGLKSVMAGLGGALVLLGAFAPLDEAAAQATTGVTMTRHNLGSGSAADNNRFSGTTEVCVFCHTPHGSNTGVAAPLWNKAAPAGAGYQVYNTSVSSTMDSVLATDGITGAPSIGSVSIACLSCHDGTQAMNNMINQPGSGGYNAAGASMTGTWTGGTSAGTSVVASMLNTGIGNLTQDLRNDHPIGIPYCGGGYTTAAGTGTCADLDFTAPLNAVIGGTRVFWVETGGGTTRSKTDMVLYNRTFALGVGPSVECATCHDPHIQNVGGLNPTFLRKANTNSDVCLACHVK